MADRPVTHSRKDHVGNITAIGKPGETWSPRLSADAIRDIETGLHSYYIGLPEKRVGIRVIPGVFGKYLSTSPDGTTSNNLDFLPDF